MPDQIITRRNSARDAIAKSIGSDKLWYLVNGVYIRNDFIDTTKHYSIVDTVDVFTNTMNDPRRYWNDKKKSLIGSNSELSEKIGQLKLIAPDGKRRLTDVAPLWAILGLISRLDTEPANDLINTLFKGIASSIENAALRYHAGNIERGYEWKANSIHETMKQLEPPTNEGLLWWQK